VGGRRWPTMAIARGALVRKGERGCAVNPSATIRRRSMGFVATGVTRRDATRFEGKAEILNRR